MPTHLQSVRRVEGVAQVFFFAATVTSPNAAGKRNVCRVRAVVLADHFFEAADLARRWTAEQEARGAEVQATALRPDAAEDVLWPIHVHSRKWRTLAESRVELYRCSFVRRVPLARPRKDGTDTRDVSACMYMAASSLDTASKALAAWMDRDMAAKTVRKADATVLLVPSTYGDDEDMDADEVEDDEDEDEEDVDMEEEVAKAGGEDGKGDMECDDGRVEQGERRDVQGDVLMQEILQRAAACEQLRPPAAILVAAPAPAPAPVPAPAPAPSSDAEEVLLPSQPALSVILEDDDEDASTVCGTQDVEVDAVSPPPGPMSPAVDPVVVAAQTFLATVSK